ncbi:MAG: hypothetical protein WC050_03915 [Candidatus Paceibacterota bacterium]
MGLSHKPRARKAFKSPATRAREARDAFVSTLLSIKGRAPDAQISSADFEDDLLSMVSTAELAKKISALTRGSHKNLRDRSPNQFSALSKHVLSKLKTRSAPTSILRSLRGKAREIGVSV